MAAGIDMKGQKPEAGAMPELPEVEVLARHLDAALRGAGLRRVEVRQPKAVAPENPAAFARRLEGSRVLRVWRRAKFLVFELAPRRERPARLIGHLGMTGRMYLQPARAPLPKHAVLSALAGGGRRFVFEDPRRFGRLSFDPAGLDRLGPEPLDHAEPPESFLRGLHASRQPVKVRLLDQTLVAGIGNIYASEALFRAGIAPQTSAARLGPVRLRRLWAAIRETLAAAIEWGSTVPLTWAGDGARNRLFYYGVAGEAAKTKEDHLQVYDRAGEPCVRCGSRIRRETLGGRSTYWCPRCQRR